MKFKEQDRPLFNTGFWDGYNHAKRDEVNLFWATPEQVAGTEPVTIETNKTFLKEVHPDRVFAESALIGMDAFEKGKDLLVSTEKHWRLANGLPSEEEEAAELEAARLAEVEGATQGQQQPPAKPVPLPSVPRKQGSS